MGINEDSGNSAADTGSAVHEAVRAFHAEAKGDLAASVRSMRANLNKYPFANLENAGEQFLLYAKDVRNVNARIVLLEQEVNLTLEAHPSDKTQSPIVIVGHVDQVRRINGRLSVCDIKTGSPEGCDMLHLYTYQLAAYQLAASKKLGEVVFDSFLIRMKDYLKKRTGPVFWQAPWSVRDLSRLMDAVRRMVARIRNGEFDPTPGEHCNWCQFTNVGNCVPKLVQIGV